MATNYLGRPPKAWVLPVTKGCDRAFTVRRRNSSGALTDWDADVYITIDIDKTAPTTINAVVSESNAFFHVQSTTCDLVKNTTKWRIIMSDENGVETALAVGTFERHDG